MSEKVVVVMGDGTKMERMGACNRCGGCCDLSCSAFVWKALRNIKKDETFQAGLAAGAIMAVCNVVGTAVIVNACNQNQRVNYPFHPTQTQPQCGFKWIELQDNALR